MCKKNIEDKTNIKPIALMTANRKSSIAEHLVNYPGCGKIYEDVRFKIVQQC